MRDRTVPPTHGCRALKRGGSPREVLRYIEQAENCCAGSSTGRGCLLRDGSTEGIAPAGERAVPRGPTRHDVDRRRAASGRAEIPARRRRLDDLRAALLRGADEAAVDRHQRQAASPGRSDRTTSLDSYVGGDEDTRRPSAPRRETHSGSVPPAASVAAATVARYSASVPPGQKCVSR